MTDEQPTTPEPSWGDIARDLFGAATDLGRSVAEQAQSSVTDRVRTVTSSGRTPADGAQSTTSRSARPTESTAGVTKVVLRFTGRRVRLVGDESVATARVSGEHEMHRSGDVLEVTSEQALGPHLDPMALLRRPRNLGDLRDLGLGKELVVRVNPSLPLVLEATGSSVSSSTLPRFSQVRVTAGQATLGGLQQVEDALVQTGALTLAGTFADGRSRVRVESGTLQVALDDDADVEVHGSSQLGRISWPGEAQLSSYTAGNGRGRLDLTVVMGRAGVSHENPVDPADLASVVAAAPVVAGNGLDGLDHEQAAFVRELLLARGDLDALASARGVTSQQVGEDLDRVLVQLGLVDDPLANLGLDEVLAGVAAGRISPDVAARVLGQR